MKSIEHAIAHLKQETWAIVYSYNPPANSRNLWYDRWRYDIINDYAKAVSLIGVEPLIIDIDRFISMGRGEAKNLDFVINLNSGATPVSNIGVVQCIASWFQLDSFPNDADTIVVGEKKDICSRFFSSWFSTPEQIGAMAGDRVPVRSIMKPKTLGNSRGVRLIEIGQSVPKEYSPKNHLLEKFVEGYEVSIPVLFDPTDDQYRIMQPVIYLPKQDNPSQWYFSDIEKFSDRQRYDRRLGSVSSDLETALKSASEAFGFGDIARFDFRWMTNEPMGGEIETDDLSFLEINCLPTLSDDVSVLLSTSAFLEDHNSVVASFVRSCSSDHLRALMYLLVNARIKSLMTR